MVFHSCDFSGVFYSSSSISPFCLNYVRTASLCYLSNDAVLPIIILSGGIVLFPNHQLSLFVNVSSVTLVILFLVPAYLTLRVSLVDSRSICVTLLVIMLLP